MTSPLCTSLCILQFPLLLVWEIFLEAGSSVRNSTAMSNSIAVSPCANPIWRISSSKACSPVQVSARSCADVKDEAKTVSRRGLVIGLAGVGGMVRVVVSSDSAMAASRRAPPPPPEEKKDPNISGVQAKVLASKKRKEAMKEEVAKLREKGKPLKDQVNSTVIEKTDSTS